MFYTQMPFREYFHKFLVFEVDNLTDDFKDSFDVAIDDCFILCSNFVSDDGVLIFAVLSFGNSVETCFKGLDSDKALAYYSGFDLSMYKATRVNPPIRAIVKAHEILKRKENTNDRLEEIRNEKSLDFVRSPFFPDNLMVRGRGEYNFDIKITDVSSLVMEGIIEEDGEFSGDKVKVVPYSNMGQNKLLTIIANEDISDEDMKLLNDFLSELSRGIKKMQPKDISKS